MALIYNGKGQGWTYTPDKTDYFTDYNYSLPEWHLEQGDYLGYNGDESSPLYDLYWAQSEEEANNVTINEYNWQLYAQATGLNNFNTAKNNFYTQVNNIVNATNQGSYTYLDAKQAIKNQKVTLTDIGISDAEADNIIDGLIGSTGQYRNYYLNERVTYWDPSVLPANLSSTTKQRTDLGSNFNKYTDGKNGFYVTETKQGQDAKAVWDKAVAEDNLDIIGRYGSLEAYAKQDYLKQITDPTKSAADIAAIRGSQKAPLSPLVTEYREKVFPDAGKQQTLDEVQNKIFGLVAAKTPGATGYEFRDVQQGLSDLISSDKTINKLWTDAKNEVLLSRATGGTPGQWTKLIKNLGVNDSMITDQDSFGTLLSRVATLNTADAGDKKIIDDNNALFKTVSELKNNTAFQDLISYTPAINDAFTASVQSSEKAQIKKFGEMRQSILQDTINQLKIAKQQENNIAFFRSSSVGQEFSALTQDIKGSLLGDLGVGGITPLGSSQQNFNKKLDLGLGDIFWN